MSRIAKQPINIPSGVDVKNNAGLITVKGKNGELNFQSSPLVTIDIDNEVISCKPNNESKSTMALAGTVRSLVNNMVVGIAEGFEKKLELRGVGYRSQVKGKILNLTLGFSHPVEFAIPDGITVEAPTQTEIVVKGADKQLVGQVAANIRAYREPEPYKGKGIRYVGEHVVMKEAKKK